MATPKIIQDPSWNDLPWLVHGFSTRIGGHSTAYAQPACAHAAQSGGELNLGFTPADERETVLKNRALFSKALGMEPDCLTTLSQVHSATTHTVDSERLPPPGDGLITSTPGTLLAILTADCVPVLLVDTRQRVVAAFHAGWRGTVQRIVETGIARMRQDFNSKPNDMLALIGPAIGPCCYEVGEELRQTFNAHFTYANALFSGEKPHLDLIEANQRQLMAGGLKPKSIRRAGACTSCHPELYFSHRQSSGNTGRMMSVIGLRRQPSR